MINIPSSPSTNNNIVKKLFQSSDCISHSTSPMSFATFKLGSITQYQSSPFTQKILFQQQHHQQSPSYSNQNDDEDYDDKPKVFSCEDHVPPPHQTPALESPLSKTLNQTGKLAFTDNLNISSPNAAANESFLSSQTKSSLKTSFSALTSNSSHSGMNKEVKHVKFHHQVDTPVMFSRCSSMTSLNSFDVKSVHSSVASEYSRRPSGIMSPSEIPDSPDDLSFLNQHRLRTLNASTSVKSNEITMIERTMLLSASNQGSEKNSFYAGSSETTGSCRVGILKDNTTAYDCEGGTSPWRSEVSSLSALTFDDQNENKNSQDLASILSLLQTRSAAKKQLNLESNVHTPPVKLPATKSLFLNANFQTPNAFFNMPPAPPMSTTSSLDVDTDQIKSYAVENTPSQLSPSAGSEFSIPSLMKADIQQSQTQSINLLLSRLNIKNVPILNTIQDTTTTTSTTGGGDLDDEDEEPKVYKTEEISDDASVDVAQIQVTTLTASIENNGVDSPKVFVTEGTPMCYSRYSSTSSLNESKNEISNLNNKDNNKSNSILHDSPACHKPTNTPAGFGNMSRESYSSDDDDDEVATRVVEEVALNKKIEQKQVETNQDEVLLENFIKKMLPAPTRKSTSKLPVIRKTLVDELSKEVTSEKPKKRLSEDKKQSLGKQTNATLKQSSLKKTITQTASTYSLQTITSCVSNTSNHHNHQHHHAAPPIVAMTKTAQLRLASKNNSINKALLQTTASLKNATNTHLNRVSSVRGQPPAPPPPPSTASCVKIAKNDLLNTTATLNQQQQNDALNRRKSFHSLTPISKKTSTLTRVNENMPKVLPKIDSKSSILVHRKLNKPPLITSTAGGATSIKK